MGQPQTQRQRQANSTHRKRLQQTAMQNATSQLRRAYFAQASQAVARYNIMFDRVVEHVKPMWDAGAKINKDIRYADDLVQAIACVDGMSVAWADLVEQHERILIRASGDRFEEADSILLVRRMFVDLKRCSESGACDLQLSLRNYYGTSSLRSWLCKCLAQAMNQFVYGHKMIDNRPMRFCEHCFESLGWDAIESKLPKALPNAQGKANVAQQVAIGSGVSTGNSSAQ
ncbi:MAG: hypothetical protein IH984_04260 [Planctomycetes bacterium]|nr:hypothetical protein [Planctomycetota bacterium]